MTDSEEKIMESFPLAVLELNFLLKCLLIWNGIVTAALTFILIESVIK